MTPQQSFQVTRLGKKMQRANDTDDSDNNIPVVLRFPVRAAIIQARKNTTMANRMYCEKEGFFSDGKDYSSMTGNESRA